MSFLRTASEKPSPLPFFILPALLAVTIQFLVIPMTEIAFGQTQSREAIVLSVFLIGLAAGQAHLVPIRHIKYILVGIGFFEICIGLFYGKLLVLAAAAPVLKALLITYLFVITFIGGYILVSTIYERTTRVHKNYLLINVLSLLLVLGLITSFSFVGLHILHIAVGLTLIGLQLVQRNEVITYRPSIRLDTSGGISMLLGLASGFFVSIFFTLLYLGFYPNGLTYPLYLSLTFVMLAAAGLLEMRYRSFFQHLSVSYILVFAAVLNTLLVVLVYGGFGTSFFFDSLKGLMVFQDPQSFYWLFTLFLTLLLFLPYFFFSFSVPVQERQRPGNNHLFFVTVGNVCGILLFSIILAEVALFWKLLVFSLLPFALISLKRSQVEKLITGSMIVASFFALAIFTNTEIEKRIISQNKRIQNILWNTTPDLSQPHRVLDLELFGSTGRERGALFNVDPTIKNLGLGGYFSVLFSRHDLLQANVARELISTSDTKIERVLVLGLGNHLILENIRSELAQTNNDFAIDVIDNFGLFRKHDFRSRIGAENGFDWSKAVHTQFISGDAFQYLSQTTNTYDMIVWNLAWPNYGTAGPLFSDEFFSLITNTLTPTGFFVTNNFHNPEVDCLTVETFDHVVAYPRAASYYVSILVAESGNKKTLDTLLTGTQGTYLHDNKHCQNVRTPTLAQPFKMTPKNYGIIHQNTYIQEASFTTEPVRALGAAYGISLFQPNDTAGYYKTVVMQPTDQNDAPTYQPILSGIKHFYDTAAAQNAHLVQIPGTSDDIVNLKQFLSIQNYHAGFVSPLLSDWRAVKNHRDFTTLRTQQVKRPSLSPLPLTTESAQAINAYTLWPDFLDLIPIKNADKKVVIFKRSRETWWNEWVRDALHKMESSFEYVDTVDDLSAIHPNAIGSVIVLGGTYDDLTQTATELSFPRESYTWVPEFDANTWSDIRSARSAGWRVQVLWSPQQSAEACDFTQQYYELHREYPSPAVAYGYTTARILDHAVTADESAGSEVLSSENTPIGTIAFNETRKRANGTGNQTRINCEL